jgi:hypothetical protein
LADAGRATPGKVCGGRAALRADLGFFFEEPGCDFQTIAARGPMATAFVASGRAKLVASGELVDVELRFSPGKK